MSRARKFGALSAVLACAGLVAGCGGGGYTAAESGPTTTGSTPTATPAVPPPPGPTTPLGAYAPTDPGDIVATFKGYDQFPKDRAGTIFVDPTVKPAPVAPPVAPVLTAPVTAVPLAPVSPTPAPTTKALAKTYVATLDVSGIAQAAKVGDAVPLDSPQFTVKTLTDAKVTLKLNSGTLPGGGTTVDIGVGESVTLSNPSTGAGFVVKVTAITAQA